MYAAGITAGFSPAGCSADTTAAILHSGAHSLTTRNLKADGQKKTGRGSTRQRDNHDSIKPDIME